MILIFIINNDEFIFSCILQAGHILTIHSKHGPRLIRSIIWAVIMVRLIHHLYTLGLKKKPPLNNIETLKFLLAFLNTLDCDCSWLVRSNQEWRHHTNQQKSVVRTVQYGCIRGQHNLTWMKIHFNGYLIVVTLSALLNCVTTHTCLLHTQKKISRYFVIQSEFRPQSVVVRSDTNLCSWRVFSRECFCCSGEALNGSDEAARRLAKNRAE